MSDGELEAMEAEASPNTCRLKKAGRRRTYAGNMPPTRLCGPLTKEAALLGVRHGCLRVKPPRSVAVPGGNS